MRHILLRIVFLFFITAPIIAQQHPITYNTSQDYELIRKSLPNNPLLKESFDNIKNSVDEWIGKDVDVPIPEGLEGGYNYERHKGNYRLMFNSSLLYQITGESKYAELTKTLFFKYAKLIPTLKNHPQSSGTVCPGRIFYQALNDANWLVFTGLAFDGIYNYLTPQERKTIAEGAFKPEIEFFTNDLEPWFSWIHNHALWSTAAVGIVGIATDNKAYVDMALYGKHKDGKSGYLANIDGLLSPDGYYTEGPYYTRYAILPLYFFANALQHYNPALKVFNRRNNVLQKTLTNALQQTNLRGEFYSFNDAVKEKNVTCYEIVEALDIAWNVFGVDTSLLPIARMQKRVTLSSGGAGISDFLNKRKVSNDYYAYKPIEFKDGAKGDEGGISVLRSGKGDSLVSLIYKYSAHGLSHGHYDKLNINLYDGKNEILTDYGAARFVNIEQKLGGKYLPETESYSKQTISHNTVVVDEKSNFNGKEEVSQKHHSNLLLSNINNEFISKSGVEVVSAFDDNAYGGVRMQRTLYMLNLPTHNKPLIVDVFNTLSNNQHQYDLPFHYIGTLMKTNFKYYSQLNNQATFGNANGYQHLWKEAEANIIGHPITQFSFLNENTFYTISSLTDDSTSLFFTRIGANDPNLNLRREPALIIRKQGRNQSFVNVVELHGKYDANAEITLDAYSSVKNIELLQNDARYTVVNILYDNKPLIVIQRNSNFDNYAINTIEVKGKTYSFKGNYTVLFDGKILVE